MLAPHNGQLSKTLTSQNLTNLNLSYIFTFVNEVAQDLHLKFIIIKIDINDGTITHSVLKAMYPPMANIGDA